VEIALAILGVIGTLGGVLLGWRLSLKTSREERVWQERQTVRQRQETAAAALDAAVIEVGKLMPKGVVDGREAFGSIDAAQARLREAWSRATVLANAEIDRRLHALDTAMFIASQDISKPGQQQVSLWPLDVAFRELRAALVAFQRREEPPEAAFPTTEQIFELVHPGGRTVGLQGVSDYLTDRGVTG
jgi:hypothetical protein